MPASAQAVRFVLHAAMRDENKDDDVQRAQRADRLIALSSSTAGPLATRLADEGLRLERLKLRSAVSLWRYLQHEQHFIVSRFEARPPGPPPSSMMPRLMISAHTIPKSCAHLVLKMRWGTDARRAQRVARLCS